MTKDKRFSKEPYVYPYTFNANCFQLYIKEDTFVIQDWFSEYFYRKALRLSVFVVTWRKEYVACRCDW